MQGKEQQTNLWEIGATVRIDLSKVEDKIPIGLSEIIKSDPFCKIIDYKMTDGTGIGVVVRLKGGHEMWLFNTEIYSNDISPTSEGPQKNLLEWEREEKLSKKKKFNSKDYTYTKNIYDLINPINFTKWLIYSSKDII